MIRLSGFIIGLIVPIISFAQSLTLVDLNLRYDNPNDGVNAWSNRKKSTLNWLENQDADLYFFQEVLHHQYIDLQEQLDGYKCYGVGREDGNKKGEYCPIFYKTDRFDLKESMTIWLSPTINTPSKGWDAACERIANIVILQDKTDAYPLVCINTHWDHVGKVAQENSAEIISAVLYSMPARYQILGGDFNVTSIHPGLQKISEQLNLMQGRDSRDTYHGFKDEITTENGPIDLVFASDALQTTNFQYFRHSTEGKLLSDHDALLIEWSKTKLD